MLQKNVNPGIYCTVGKINILIQVNYFTTQCGLIAVVHF